jgi:hypothetical protein
MEKLGGEGSFQYNSLADPPRDHPNRRGSLTVIPPPGHPSAWPKVADEEWPVAHRWLPYTTWTRYPMRVPTCLERLSANTSTAIAQRRAPRDV